MLDACQKRFWPLGREEGRQRSRGFFVTKIGTKSGLKLWERRGKEKICRVITERQAVVECPGRHAAPEEYDSDIGSVCQLHLHIVTKSFSLCDPPFASGLHTLDSFIQ